MPDPAATKPTAKALSDRVCDAASPFLEGLPADEMQAAAWVLVQRVRGLHDDLNRLQGALVRSRGMREAVSEARTHRG